MYVICNALAFICIVCLSMEDVVAKLEEKASERRVLREIRKRYELTKSALNVISDAFDRLDRDSSGEVDAHEFREGMLMAGVGVSKEQQEILTSLADTQIKNITGADEGQSCGLHHMAMMAHEDGDGVLSRAEFVCQYCSFPVVF